MNWVASGDKEDQQRLNEQQKISEKSELHGQQ